MGVSEEEQEQEDQEEDGGVHETAETTSEKNLVWHYHNKTSLSLKESSRVCLVETISVSVEVVDPGIPVRAGPLARRELSVVALVLQLALVLLPAAPGRAVDEVAPEHWRGVHRVLQWIAKVVRTGL